MRKFILFAVIAFLAVSLTSTAVMAKSHKVKLHSEATVAGQVIEPGSYMVKLDDEGMLTICKGSKVLAESEVTVLPLGNETPNSVSLDVNGNLKEIRFKDEKVVFPKLSNAGQTSE